MRRPDESGRLLAQLRASRQVLLMSNDAPPPDRPLLGIGMRIISATGFALMAALLKAASARGAGTSVYFRDPDGSLLEFIAYT